MKLIDDLLNSVSALDCRVKRVCVGLHWTVVESRYVGMAHTFKTSRKVELELAGNLVQTSALSLAERLRSWEPLEASLGLAALNSLIDPVGNQANVLDTVLEMAKEKVVTVIGRFPSNQKMAKMARRAYFLEMNPQKKELPSCASEEVIPKSNVVVITATTLINKTLPRILELARNATAIVLGPSTPMNNILFSHGADYIGGVQVVDPDALFGSVMQGVKTFRKLAGIEAVTRIKVDQ